MRDVILSGKRITLDLRERGLSDRIPRSAGVRRGVNPSGNNSCEHGTIRSDPFKSQKGGALPESGTPALRAARPPRLARGPPLARPTARQAPPGNARVP